MELERLKQAFNIKEEPTGQTQTLDPNDPRLIAAKKAISREQTSIIPLLVKIKDHIDAGEGGAASGEIETAEKMVQTNNVPGWERVLLSQYKDMLK